MTGAVSESHHDCSNQNHPIGSVSMTPPTVRLGLPQIIPVAPVQVCEKYSGPARTGLIPLNKSVHSRLRKNGIFSFSHNDLHLRIRLVEDAFLVYPLGHQRRTK